MRIAAFQLNPVIGDLVFNSTKIVNCLKEAQNNQADLVVFSELIVSGYPPRDLLFEPLFIKNHEKAILLIAKKIKKEVVILGGFKKLRGELFNGAFVLSRGKIIKFIGKKLLPNNDVFDESRYFSQYAGDQFFKFKDQKIGVTICEDIWNHPISLDKQTYKEDPIQQLKKEHVDLVINMSASPYTLSKQKMRVQLLKAQAKRLKAPILYVNQVGGNDELIFDGHSMFVDSQGRVVKTAKTFAEDALYFSENDKPQKMATNSELANIKNALVLGLHDYVIKTGFKKVVLGLSGGIDSALVAQLAVEALGAENVLGVLMPSRFTSQESLDDAALLAKNLKIQTKLISIESVHVAFEDKFKDLSFKSDAGVAFENIQARIRGNLLMALSNAEGYLVLTTGNKSEMSVGYCTLYGDMAGGLAVIGDLPKLLVYQLSQYMNKDGVIPKRIYTKAPTAELRPNQTDQDSLPAYEDLDKILFLMIEKLKSNKEIAAQGFDRKVVEKIRQLVCLNEYKRRQAAPVLKITSKAFGTGRRYPIASRLTVV